MLHKRKCANLTCHNNWQPVSASILFWKQTDSLCRKRSSEAPLLDREGCFSSAHDLDRLSRFLSRMLPLMKSLCLNLAFKNGRLFSFRPKKQDEMTMKSTDHHFQRPNHRHRHFRSHHCWKMNPPVWSLMQRVGLPGKKEEGIPYPSSILAFLSCSFSTLPFLFLFWFLPCSMFCFAREANADLFHIHGRKVKWRIARLSQKRKEQMASKAAKTFAWGEIRWGRKPPRKFFYW